MWADAEIFATTYLINFFPTEVAELLNAFLETVAQALEDTDTDTDCRVWTPEHGLQEDTDCQRYRLPEVPDFTIKIVRKLLVDLALEKPVYFLNVCPADVLRGAELADAFADSTSSSEASNLLEYAYPLSGDFGAGNILEYDYPLYSDFEEGRFDGLGCSLVRAMKIPSNVASMSHDSSVGAEPHNYFSFAFNGATFEQRTPTLFAPNRFVAQQIYVMRYPILQTVWGENGLGLVSEDEIRIQVCPLMCIQGISRPDITIVLCALQVLGRNLLREDMIRKKYPKLYTDCGESADEQCPDNYPGAKPGSKEWNEVMKFTSAVRMFGKSALKKRRESRKKKDEANKKDEAATSSSGQQKCASGQYAEAAASKSSRVPDITLKSKQGKILGRYNCKGGTALPLLTLGP